jgi:hypothetical protein
MAFHGKNVLPGPGIVLNILKSSPINIKCMASSQVSHMFREFRELLHLKIRITLLMGVPCELNKIILANGVHNWV